MEQFGEKIREKRKSLKLTQTEVSREINVSRQTISSWENGKSYPDILTLIALSNFYSLSLDYLMKEDIKYISKIKKDNVSLGVLKLFFIAQLILGISFETHFLIISGSAIVGILGSLLIFGISLYLYSCYGKYNKR